MTCCAEAHDATRNRVFRDNAGRVLLLGQLRHQYPLSFFLNLGRPCLSDTAPGGKQTRSSPSPCLCISNAPTPPKYAPHPEQRQRFVPIGSMGSPRRGERRSALTSIATALMATTPEPFYSLGRLRPQHLQAVAKKCLLLAHKNGDRYGR